MRRSRLASRVKILKKADLALLEEKTNLRDRMEQFQKENFTVGAQVQLVLIDDNRDASKNFL